MVWTECFSIFQHRNEHIAVEYIQESLLWLEQLLKHDHI